MKKVYGILIASMVLLLAISCNRIDNKQQNMATTEKNLIPKGEKASSEYFTGDVWVKTLVKPEEVDSLYVVGSVTFNPGARTKWHTHPVGQVLIVTEGSGWYQERGKPAQKLTKGDVIAIPKDIEHWHGAAADSSFVHIAITNYKDNKNVSWMSPVTDKEYESLKTEK